MSVTYLKGSSGDTLQWQGNLTVDGTQVFTGGTSYAGDVTLGDAVADTTILKGRMATGSAAGTALSLGATYLYNEHIELRANVTDWATKLANFTGAYFRYGNTVKTTAYNLTGMELNVSSDASVVNLSGLYSETQCKALAAGSTWTDVKGIEANLSLYDQTQTVAVTEAKCFYATIGLGSGYTAYTGIHGMVIETRDGSVGTRTIGSGIILRNKTPAEGTQTFTKGLQVAMACTTGVSLEGAMTTGVNISGAIGTGVNIAGSAMTYGLSIGITGVTYTGGILLGTGGGTITTGISMLGTQTTGINFGGTAMGTGISFVSACTTPILINSTSTADAILISATTPVDGIHISSACSANAINVSGASSVGLRLPVTLTDYGVFIDGGTGSFVPFQVGIKGSDTGAAYGLALVGDTDNSGGVQIYADDGNVALTADVSAGLRSRVYLKANHTAGKTVYGAWGQLVTAASKTMNDGVFGAVYAFNQIGTTLTLTGTAEYKAVSATTTIAGVNTIGASCIFAGVDVNIGGSGGSFAGTTGNVSGVLIRGKDSVVWPVGLQITGSSATTGILIGACTTGVKVSGTLATVSSRAFSAIATVNIANYGDGYGLTESELTLTGTAAGAVAAMSSWINIATGNNAGTGLVCAQTNGIWSEAGATNTNATFIFGMRAQCLASGAAPAFSFPFSIVNQVNVTTALIQCNSADSDLGRVTDATPTDDNQLVPLYKDNTGVHYVKTYTYTP